ncbi:uncharacterized protein LOC123428183 isoform X2 [Hordeum vulgare subsp. vulgare]|uniref:uncharacterized protein LOC123428183 isoform X2 n=1 Tax=Hordeum vulgare subsp. vulgare TaxID=112509 RepID=UPI001D1A4A3A|nr:uncharacterized protein LOC123428183 isoform X2 [Hordeum vulgare subsp. vulgare]
MSAPFVAMSGSAVFPAHRVQVSSSSSWRRCAACFSRQSFSSISIWPAPPKHLLNLACSAKQDTIDKVCGIVKRQLAVAQDTLVNGDTKFADLGADSLNTRIKEIVCAAELRLDTVSLWLVLSRSNRLGLLKSAPQRLQTPSLQRTRPSASDRPATVVRLLQSHRVVVLPSKWLLIVHFRQGKRMDGYIPAHFTAIAYALPPSSMRQRLPAPSMA